jgi:hypothetical protein
MRAIGIQDNSIQMPKEFSGIYLKKIETARSIPIRDRKISDFNWAN